MLKSLRIRNLVTIEDLAVEFAPGLNVLTGETGAGKSILVDALGWIAGERAEASLLRSGADRAVVEAVFEMPGLEAALEARGLDTSEDGTVVRREVAPSGGRALVNGSPTTVGVLRELGERLLERHRQHDQRGLADAETHLELLDAFGGHEKAILEVARAHEAASDAQARLLRIESLARDGAARAAELGAVAREIRAADPRPGESEALRRERAILQNGAQVAELLAEAIGRLDEGEAPAVASLHAAERRVADLARFDPSVEDLASRLAAARLEAEDVRDTLAAYRDGLSFEPGRLEAIETRRAMLDRLLLRFGPAEEDALRAAEAAERDLAAIGNVDADRDAARADLDRAANAYGLAAAKLTSLREAAAARLGPAVEAELAPLALGKARFAVSLPPRPSSTPFPAQGAERAEFLLAANPGEPPRPLGRAASGGELSRVLLALHVVLEDASARRVLVFDEVDAGVSGAVAVALGERLARLARRHQVLCVTHLPQVAAHAAAHYHVAKRVAGGRTRTTIERLTDDGRVDELARMLGGREAGRAARENAAELLGEAAASGRARGRR